MYICSTVILICVHQGIQDEIHITNIREIAIFYGFEWKPRKSYVQFISYFYKKQSFPIKVVFGPCFLNHVSLNFIWSFVILVSVYQGGGLCCALPKHRLQYPTQKILLKLKNKQTGKKYPASIQQLSAKLKQHNRKRKFVSLREWRKNMLDICLIAFPYWLQCTSINLKILYFDCQEKHNVVVSVLAIEFLDMYLV